MAKSKSSKIQTVADLASQLKSAKGLVFANYTGLTVKEMQELRKALRVVGVSYEVAAKTLISRAFGEVGLDSNITKSLSGGVSVAISQTDEVSPARALLEFSKTHDKFQLIGGLLEAKFIDAVRVKELAKLPSRAELLAKLVGSIKSPLNGLAQVLQGNLRGLVQVLSAKANKQ